MSATVIDEFLVALGYKIDEGSKRRFEDALASATKQALALTAALQASAIAAIGVVQRIASGFEQLHYASRRVGASAQNIREFQHAVGQLGGTAEGALGSLENFARKIRETTGPNGKSGIEAWLQSFGVTTRTKGGSLRDTSTLMNDLFESKKFNALGQGTKISALEMLGIDWQTYQAAIDPEFKKFRAEIREKYRAAGLDPDDAAEAGKRFEQVWRSFGATVGVIRDQVAMAMAGPAGKEFDKLIRYLDEHSGEIAKGLVAIGNAIVTAATWLAKLVIKFGEWGHESDGWIKSITGVTGGFEKLAAALILLTPLFGGLILKIGALVASTAWKALFGGLAALGLPGAALAIGALAVGGAVEAGKAFTETEEEAAKNHRGWNPIDMAARGWRRARQRFGGPADMSGGKTTARGTLATNQKEAYAAAREAGLSDMAAKALVANMSGEGLHVPGDMHWDGTHYARGIVQWDPQRSEAIRQKFGKYPNELSVADQTRAAIWEIQNNPRFAATRRALLGNDAGAMIGALVDNYESPADRARAKSQRAAFYNGLGHLGDAGSELPPGARWVAIPGGGMVAVDKDGRSIPSIPLRGGPSYNPGVSAIPGRGMVMPANPYGALTPAGPIGGSTTINSRSFGDNIIHAKNTFHVTSPDPGAAARSIAGVQTRTNADLVRNLQGSAR